MTPIELFQQVFAAVGGVFAAILTALVACHGLALVGELIIAATEALRRCAHRKEIVVETFFPETLETKRFYRNPTPDRVALVKKADKKR